ncbi:hypothetical protein QR680_017066 [Steinernema hermaphroditum]|uniref:RYYR-CCHC domain-containing protein n=1 Tax=Steinernema hermaphroditum TaxID=289476 RepID=A0AA39LNC1_9BILA|nr:hypothetical protein QR680_017066 [Steinernema hermaphroditum]
MSHPAGCHWMCQRKWIPKNRMRQIPKKAVQRPRRGRETKTPRDLRIIDVVGGIVSDVTLCEILPGPSTWKHERERRGRINWNRPEVQHLLLELNEKRVDRQTVVECLEKLTGIRVTTATVARQAQKLKIPNELDDESYVAMRKVKSNSKSPVADDDEEDEFSTEDYLDEDGNWIPRFEWSFTQRGSRGLMVFETENRVRLYRLGGKTADGGDRACYFRCSQCDRLRFRSTPIKFEYGVLANSLTPAHDPNCRPLTMNEALNQQLDRQARSLVKTGVPPKKAHDLIKRSSAGGEGLMPDFKRVSKAYYRVRRWAKEHQVALGFRPAVDNSDDKSEDGDKLIDVTN